MTSLLPRIESAADSKGTITFLGSAGSGGPDGERVSWGRLHEDACAMAAALQARGVGPGTHVAILGPTTRALVTAIEATWLAGAAAVMLPLPMRLASIDDFVRQTRVRLPRVRLRVLLVIDPQLTPFIAPEPGDPPVVGLDELLADAGRPKASAYVRPADDPDALAILQYTSGSTSDPKGVMLPHRCVTANLDGIVAAAGLTRDDVGVSWLPLYHDMGLIGLLATPMTIGMDLALRGAARFPRRAGALDGMDGPVRRHGDRRTELLLRARGPRLAPAPRTRPGAVVAGPQWCGAGRPRFGRGIRRRGSGRTGSGPVRSSPRSAWPRPRSR